MNIKIINIDTTDSTNRYLHEYQGEEGSIMTIATANYQTAGRGQGTNHWESEPYKNLLFSVKTHPQGVPVARQYVMLEAGALAIADTLTAYINDVSIKWPNDIYWKDSKISGTLSECAISGPHIRQCILGTGININQQHFVSDAPNPVSLRQITGHEVCCEEVLQRFIKAFSGYLQRIKAGQLDGIDQLYAQRLYRKQGLHAYRDADGCFMARIVRVEQNGHLVLEDEQGKQRTYAFKEVSFVINNKDKQRF